MTKEERLQIRIDEEGQRWERLTTIISRLKLSRDLETRPEEVLRLDHLIKEAEMERGEVGSKLDNLEDRLFAPRASDGIPHKSAGVGVTRGEPVEVFYSYAHEDEDLREELDKHLALLKNEGVINPWHDRKIKPGDDWDREIRESLERAHIILLLVSPDFMASDYIWGKELKRAMERQDKDEAVVIPIILRPSNWSNAPFAKLQAIPKNAKAATLWPDRDQVFANIAGSVGIVAREISEK